MPSDLLIYSAGENKAVAEYEGLRNGLGIIWMIAKEKSESEFCLKFAFGGV